MNRIKAIIIDDEIEAREGVKLFLEQDTEIEITAICKNGIEGINKINHYQPDLIFLDIQMPEVNGFDVLSSIDETKTPEVIFITAYDQYALKAFDLHAIGYLLKPFSDEKFFAALNHAKKKLLNPSLNEINNKLNSLIHNYEKDQKDKNIGNLIFEKRQTNSSFPNRLIVKTDGKVYFVNLNEIIWVESYDYYVKVHTKERFYLLRQSMKKMETILPSHQFIRIHKTSIINTFYVKELEPYFKGDSIIHLSTGLKLKLSRNYKKNFIDLIGGV